jgi:hypothetical protein
MAENQSPPRRRGWLAALVAAGMPSFFLSATIHISVLVLLAVLLHSQPRGAAVEPSREVGVVLKRVDERGEQYYEMPNNVAAPPSPTPSAEGTVRDIVGEVSPVDVTAALPKKDDRIGVGPLVDPGSATGVAGMTEGEGPNKAIKGGMARTQVYGVPGEGDSFLYVFDRSGSMEGGPLRSAKAQLIASLQSLGETTRFQIIFYNEEPAMFNPTGVSGRLVFGTQQNKDAAIRFINGITAQGGTRHAAALSAALAMDPDVIFFLTDADQPALTEPQLQVIRRSNRGAKINTIEFGLGPKVGEENFLARIARQNNGEYKYIDITTAGIK